MYQKENWQGQFLYKSIPTEGERLCLIHICFFFCCQLHFVTMAIAQEWLLASVIVSALYRESELREVIDTNQPDKTVAWMCCI